MVCVICHFATETDDVIIASPHGHCICLRCWARVTETEHRMPKALRREVIAALAQVEEYR